MKTEETARAEASRPRLVVTYIAGLVTLAAGLEAASIAWGRTHPVHDVAWVVLAPLLGLLVAAEYFQIRFQYRDDVMALNLFDAALAPLIVAFPAAAVIGTVALAQLIAAAIRRNQPLKASFNVAQWAVAAGVGSLLYRIVGGDARPTNTGLLILVLALSAMALINTLALAVVIRLAQHQPVRRVLANLAPTILVSWVLNTPFALLFVTAVDSSRVTVVLFAVPLLMLHWASRGYAAARADRARIGGLQQATHVLAQPVDPRDAIGLFVAEVRECFEAECAELVLISPEGHEVHRADANGHRVTGENHPLGAALIHAGRAVRLTTVDPTSPLADVLERAGWRDCSAAPVRSGQRLIGVLCTYNRGGLEGFEEGELAVLEALANEVAGALHKAELLATILEERRKLSEIVDNTSDGIFTLDPAGVVESWNSALESLTGYPGSEMIGTSHLGVLRPRDAAGSDVLFERWAEDAELPADVQVLTSAGELRWLSCSYTRVPAGDDRPPLLVVVGRDVTKARELERLKEEFVATVSHELRTPLTPIKGFATTLLEGGDRMSSETRRTAVESILRSAQRLERLILNLLEVSRIESRVIDVRNSSVEVGSLARRVVTEFRDAWGDRDIEVTAPKELCHALGSELWIEQILSNLLSNALKYAPGTDAIEVRVRPDLDAIELSVVDHGPGIPAEAAERVFERFERLDRTNRQAGTGLGLYIARELAHAMNGTLTLAETPGHGATFSLRLRPAAPLRALV
jgi:PAS domain S-box-containing protein